MKWKYFNDILILCVTFKCIRLTYNVLNVITMTRILVASGFILLILFACKRKTEKEVVLDFYEKGKLNGTVLIVKEGKVGCDTALG